jgi:hypothetical protein
MEQMEQVEVFLLHGQEERIADYSSLFAMRAAEWELFRKERAQKKWKKPLVVFLRREKRR